MSRVIRARIGAARLVLFGLQGSDSLEPASLTQQRALLAEVGRHRLTTEEQVELSELALAVPWHEPHRKAVAEAFVPTLDVKARRMPMQDFTALHEYFTAAEWAVFGKRCSMTLVLELVRSRATALGCRAPSEPTLKWVTSIVLVLSTDQEQLLSMPGALKHDVMKTVRKDFKQSTRRLDRPVDVIEALPRTPAGLLQSSPASFRAAFPNDGPIPCPIDVARIMSVDASFRCRGTGGAEAQIPIQVDCRAQPSFDGRAMERVATSVMQGLSQISATQQLLIQHMGGRSGSFAPVAHCGDMLPHMQPLLALGGVATRPQAFGCPSPMALPGLALPGGDTPGSGNGSRNSSGSSSSLGDNLPLWPLSSEPAVALEEPAVADDHHKITAAASEAIVPIDPAAPIKDLPAGLADGSLRLLAAYEAREASKKKTRAAGAPGTTGQETRTATGASNTKKPDGKAPSKKAATKAAAKAQGGKKARGCGLDGGAAAQPASDSRQGRLPSHLGKRPFFCVERSRSQVMCRTGAGGAGSTHKIAFGPDTDHADEASAVAAARLWVETLAKKLRAS